MHISDIHLAAHDLPAQRKFYGETLGLPFVEDRQDSFVVQAGSSRLTFVQSPNFTDLYHFAFNIPENQLGEARVWLQERTTLLSAEDQDVFHFADWNAHALYFHDAAGNIVELIARHNLPNADNKLFSVFSLLCVSEIGFAADDVPDAVQKLVSALNVPIYDGENSATFTAVGDENGLLIVVKRGRTWFPQTNIPAEANPFAVTFPFVSAFSDASLQDTLLSATALISAELEQNFIASWDGIEKFFEELAQKYSSWAWLTLMSSFIHVLRENGNDKKLRAGQSMWYLILSRSEKHGLRGDQAHIMFKLYPQGEARLLYYQYVGVPSTLITELLLNRLTLSDEVKELLTRLLMQPIS